MLLTFTPRQFGVLRMGFEIGDPSPDEAVPAELLAQVRQRFATATDCTLDLTPDLIEVLEACFVVGTEDDPDISDFDYNSVMNVLRSRTVVNAA